jgi:hypothetical protein
LSEKRRRSSTPEALGLSGIRGAKMMHKTMLAAFGAATMAFAVPAAAQELPLVTGDFWNVAEITIDDGQFATYADHLAGQYRKSMDFQKSKGWIKDYYILSNNNKRAGEPDLYLVTIFDHVTTPAEDIAREKEINAFLAETTRNSIAGSGNRAKYRKLGGNLLLQELKYKK